MIKYAIGRRCQVVSQRYTTTNKSLPAGQDNRWICEQLDIFDGTNDANGRIDDSKPLLTITAETSSNQPLISSRQSELKLEFPQDFLIPGRLYTYSPLGD